MNNNRMTVKCSVDSCEYWDAGNYCGADGIEVDNVFATTDASMEIGTIGSDKRSAKTSEETCCRTFKPKNK